MSLFAALIGVAYPLILQAAQRIDDKYHSTTLTQYIFNKPSFKLFRGLMPFAIIVAICAPFALYIYSSNTVLCYTVMGFQAILTCAQLFNLYYINHVIQESIVTPRFLEMLNAENGDTNARIREIFDFSRLYILETNPDLIMQAAGIVLTYLEGAPQQESDKSEKILDSIRKLLEESDSKRQTIYCQSSRLWDVMLSREIVSKDETQYKWLWRFLQASIKANNSDHIVRYWTYADQYAGGGLGQMEDADAQEEDAKSAFAHFNTMVCASLVYSENWKVLNDVLYHSHVYPPKYDLLPNTFGAIVDELRYIDSREFNWLTSFTMYGMKGGVMIDTEIKGQAVRYLALAYLRLQSVKDYNITYSDPMRLPILSDNISQCRKDLESAEWLLRAVQIWQQQPDAVNQCLAPRYDYSGNANGILKQYIQELNDHINYLLTHPNVSRTKVQQFANELKETINGDSLNLPAINTKPTDLELVYKNTRYEYMFPVEKTYLAEGNEWGYFLPETMVKSINNDVRWTYYSQCFLVKATRKSYTIGYNQIVKAVERLELDDKFEVWVSGNFVTMYRNIDPEGAEKLQAKGEDSYILNGCEIRQFECRMNVVIVTKKGDMPVAYSKEYAYLQERGMAELDDKTHFYSNIENEDWAEPDETHYGINIGRIVEFYAPKDYEYVLLKLTFPDVEPSSLNEIEPIEKIFVLNRRTRRGKK